MQVLKRLLQIFLQRKDNSEPEQPRVFLQDEELIAAIKDIAKQQHRTEEDIIADFTKAGLNQLLTQNELENRWAALSHREQQVVALICLGYRNYEIAEMLVIAPETVKTHLHSIFNKFDLRSSKELRLALKHWDFREWWDHNKQQE
jgi:ATP/maltotriose-dependent transcriptional regulator MalT